MYEFARGPLVWIAFLVFFFGSIWRVWSIIRLGKKDKVVHPYLNVKYALRSIGHWIIPYGSVNMRMRPVFTILSFVFHLGLVVLPFFVFGHLMLLNESWGVAWAALPECATNAFTLLMVGIGVIFFVRRIADPTVRFVTSLSDYLILLVVLGPFITGLFAYYQVLPSDIAVTMHIVAGALWLMAIPFTRLSHMLFFPMTRGYMGSEMGFVRNAKDW